MQSTTANKISKHFVTLVIIGLAANATGLFNDILDQDSALYASIAKNIVVKNDWVNLYAFGDDWLDKPHLPFWLSALSFKFFGINPFAYKLPSFLCFFVGVFYTYKLAAKIYNKQVAQATTLIYITSLHVILSNFDVRAEGSLTAFVVASIYHFYCAMESPWLKNLIAAAFYAALAMMTKGIFVLITIASGFVVYWIVTKQWKEFINPKWYLLLLLSFVFIAPELYSLYQQFDLHPEKLVFETHNVSGLKFFFWDSQFGRFFNTGPIKGSGDLSFFFHTTLWAFLPWAFYLFIAVYNKIKNIKTNKKSTTIIIHSSALISFLLFSVSKFQLPHYIVIIFPMFSMLVADYLLNIKNEKVVKQLNIVQYVVYFVLIVFISIASVFFRLDNVLIPLISAMIATYLFLHILKEKTVYGIITKGLCFSVLLALFLNIVFYPQLMQYQAGMMAGKWQQKNMPDKKIQLYKSNDFSFEFYGNVQMKRENNIADLFKNDVNPVFYTTKNEAEKINKDSFCIKEIAAFSYFHVTQITPTFFNYKTRSQTLDTFVIAEVKAVKKN